MPTDSLSPPWILMGSIQPRPVSISDAIFPFPLSLMCLVTMDTIVHYHFMQRDVSINDVAFPIEP